MPTTGVVIAWLVIAGVLEAIADDSMTKPGTIFCGVLAIQVGAFVLATGISYIFHVL
jgi:hypothetical protein